MQKTIFQVIFLQFSFVLLQNEKYVVFNLDEFLFKLWFEEF